MVPTTTTTLHQRVSREKDRRAITTELIGHLPYCNTLWEIEIQKVKNYKILSKFTNIFNLLQIIQSQIQLTIYNYKYKPFQILKHISPLATTITAARNLISFILITKQHTNVNRLLHSGSSDRNYRIFYNNAKTYKIQIQFGIQLDIIFVKSLITLLMFKWCIYKYIV